MFLERMDLHRFASCHSLFILFLESFRLVIRCLSIARFLLYFSLPGLVKNRTGPMSTMFIYAKSIVLIWTIMTMVAVSFSDRGGICKNKNSKEECGFYEPKRAESRTVRVNADE